MKYSTDRILTTHVGSMPRPDDLIELLRKEDRGEPVNQVALQRRAAEAVKQTVAEQIEAGVDVVCDGEFSKMSYHVYAKHRLTGLGNIEGSGVPGRKAPRDLQDFPELQLEQLAGGGTDLLQSTVCSGAVAYADPAPLNRDIANLKAAISATKPNDVFMNSASPGCLTTYIPNTYYPSRDEYRDALVSAMRPEYKAIYDAGFVLQLDCPDLAGARHTDYQDMTEAEFLADAEKSIEAINAATKDIPPEAMRLHICWLNYPGPHTHDIPVARLIELLGKARPQAILFEGANPRHEHEWEDWKAAKISDDKVLVPGVIDSTSNFVEHPRLIAQRICRYADIVGRERVLAGVDCGFGTYAGRKRVFPSVVLAKFRALAEGARMATERLWK
ncbi:MAG: cobalamin-independent methionine synthase II family protein [Rhodospirillales bacterium]|nr:cobalamin-independent methionine synthase II family protein [Rhodospirillales bacterium]